MCQSVLLLVAFNMYMCMYVSMSRETNLSPVLGSVHVSLGIPCTEIRREGKAGGLRCFLALGELSCLLRRKTVIQPPACSFLAWDADVGLAGQFARSLGWLEACMPSRAKVRDPAKARRISGMCTLALEPSSSILVAGIASARGGITPASS